MRSDESSHEARPRMGARPRHPACALACFYAASIVTALCLALLLQALPVSQTARNVTWLVGGALLLWFLSTRFLPESIRRPSGLNVCLPHALPACTGHPSDAATGVSALTASGRRWRMLGVAGSLAGLMALAVHTGFGPDRGGAPYRAVVAAFIVSWALAALGIAQAVRLSIGVVHAVARNPDAGLAQLAVAFGSGHPRFVGTLLPAIETVLAEPDASLEQLSTTDRRAFYTQVGRMGPLCSDALWLRLLDVAGSDPDFAACARRVVRMRRGAPSGAVLAAYRAYNDNAGRGVS